MAKLYIIMRCGEGAGFSLIYKYFAVQNEYAKMLYYHYYYLDNLIFKYLPDMIFLIRNSSFHSYCRFAPRTAEH
jgi:hypothetical protein